MWSAAPATLGGTMLVTLNPGTYTVQVTDLNGATGTALVEVYEVK